MALAFLLFSALGCLVLLLLYVTLFDIHGIPLYSIVDEYSKGRPVLWSDEFEAEGYPSEINWIPEVGGAGWGNNELQYYTRNSNAYVSNGNLVISTKKERFRDIMENVGFDPNTVHATVHTEKFNHLLGTQIGNNHTTVASPSDEFHTYSLDWTPSYIKAFVDDVLFFEYSKTDSSFGAWPFDADFNIILNVAVGGSWGGAQGVDTTIFPTKFTIEYVRQYQNGYVQIPVG